MKPETTYDHVAHGTNTLAKIGLNVISGTANIAKTGVLMVGGAVTTAMAIDTYAFFNHGLHDMGEFFRFNHCGVPAPTILNILNIDYRFGICHHERLYKEAIQLFQNQALLIPVVVTGAALACMVFHKIETGAARLEKKL